MQEIQKTQEKLLATPTEGVASEHSAYYRRLLSAGYKGFNQGLIGGSTLFGTIGLVIGTLIAIPIAVFTGGLAPLLLIPAVAGIGALHGAETFSHIGTQAAIAAEAAETNEMRRLLLDQLAESKNPDERAQIKAQLNKQLESKPLKKLFHWKSVLIGAALGSGIALAVTLLTPYLGSALLPETIQAVATHMHFLTETVALTSAAGTAAAGEITLAFTGIGMAIMTAIGGLSGAVIGIDREYVRRWLDGAESVVNDPKHVKSERDARIHEVNLLLNANQKNVSANEAEKQKNSELTNTLVIKNDADKPTTKISDSAEHARINDQQRVVGA